VSCQFVQAPNDQSILKPPSRVTSQLYKVLFMQTAVAGHSCANCALDFISEDALLRSTSLRISGQQEAVGRLW
jgi:hypothetical protein